MGMLDPEQPLYEELAARNAELLAVGQAALIETPRAEVAALRWQAGRDSSNSSQLPSEGRTAAPGEEEAPASGRHGGGVRAGRRRRVRRGSVRGAREVASAVRVFDVPPAAVTATLPVKDVYLCPLRRDYRQILAAG